MTKDQQDLAWACLPKEVRDEIKTQYDLLSQNPQMDKCDSVYLSAFENIFGHHNLGSDSAPEEVLMANASKVRSIYAYNDSILKQDPQHNGAKLLQVKLLDLFGDKCLPDKPNTPNSGELKPQMAENKPKFKVGDKVRIILCTHPEYRNKVGTITSIDSCGNPYVKVDGLGTLFHAPYSLEPYTEENKEPIVSSHDTMGDTKETMEVKDLNLCELLKGCEGEEFYSLMHGKVRFMTIGADGFVMFDLPESFSVYDNGKYDLNAEVIIYPSRALYEKYPLDAKKAWDEWANERKPKRWTPQIGERFFFVNAAGTVSQDFCRSEIESNGMQLKRRAIGNEFQTGKDAEAFAKIFREALTKFHEENNE